MHPILEVREVSKKFSRDLKTGVKNGLVDLGRRAIGIGMPDRLRRGEFWALESVSLDLKQGEALALLGANGSGKTTLLKIINGGYLPDKGHIRIRGRVGALIALGAGISPQMSGRENVYLLGAMMGVSQELTRSVVDEIIDFSGLHSSIDRPVKSYSSGMLIRLGFSAAVAAKPDLLLIDEVLAVGDVAFQKRCMQKLRDLKNSGTSMLIVSHSIHTMWSMCREGIILNYGRSGAPLPIEDAIREYQNLALTQLGEADYKKFGIPKVEVTVKNASEEFTTSVLNSETIKIMVNADINEEVEDACVRIVIGSRSHPVLAVLDSFEQTGRLIRIAKGKFQCQFEIHETRLRAGQYSIELSIVSRNSLEHSLIVRDAGAFTVLTSPHKFEFADDQAPIDFKATFSVIDNHELRLPEVEKR